MDPDLLQHLIDWYERRKRSLPWRTDPTPYKVLLSELMLQQTRVETVLPYFRRFLERWPTLEDLAAATEEEVVGAWAGLGYYRRARHLHRCAVQAVAQGGLPEEVAALRALPGIGPYTAGAVASIAFGQRVPLVDGNVERVLSRVLATDADPRRPPGRRALWTFAGRLHRLLPAAVHPGDLNQALMELGATVCTPRSPSCTDCPLASGCAGRGEPERYPRKRPRRPPTPITGAAGLLSLGGLPVLGRREPGGLLGGLWEPLRVDCPPSDARSALAQAFDAVGLQVEVGAAEREVVHVFTHRVLTATVHPIRWRAGRPHAGGRYDRVEAVSPKAVGLSGLGRKLLGEDAAQFPLPLPLAADSE